MSEIWNLNALCRCCHSDGNFKSLQLPYTVKNKVEIYSFMLLDTLGIQINPPPFDASFTICDSCISKLRDAKQFKKQVLDCEEKFEEYCTNELSLESGDIKIEIDDISRADHCDDGIDVMTLDDKDNLQLYDLKNDTKEEIVLCKSEVIHEETKISIEIDIDYEHTNKTKSTKKTSPKVTSKTDKKQEPTQKTNGQASVEKRQCNICSIIFDNVYKLKQHKKSCHNVKNSYKEIKCEYCDKTFSQMKIYNEHLRSHSDRLYKCQSCGKCYQTEKEKIKHETIHTKLKIYICDICNKVYHYRQTMVKHLYWHNGTLKKKLCDICGHGFNDLTNLNIHKRVVHEKLRPFKCSLCPKKLSAKKHLLAHLKTHEAPYACDLCPKVYTNPDSLEIHKMKHNNKYMCRICKDVYEDRVLYLKHMGEHVKTQRKTIKQLPQTCQLCFRHFSNKYCLKRHQLLHENKTPIHSCDICGYKFSQKSTLKRHKIRKHAGVAIVKIKCDICNRYFTDAAKHMASHGEKKYQCHLCPRTYTENNILTRHIQNVHLGRRPHPCDLCEMKYVKAETLRKHKLKSHNVKMKTEIDDIVEK